MCGSDCHTCCTVGLVPPLLEDEEGLAGEEEAPVEKEEEEEVEGGMPMMPRRITQ